MSFRILLPVAFILALGFSGRAHATADLSKAFDLYTTKVRPFMLQNCANCHSETAIYPHGPEHSHSDSRAAFSIFSKFVNWESSEASRVVKMAQNRHFCTEFDYNCNNSMAIAAAFTEVMRNYIGLLQIPGTPMGGGTMGGFHTVDGPENQTTSVKIYSEEVEYKSKFEKVSLDLSQIRKDKQSLRVRFGLTDLGQGFVRIDSALMISGDGIVRVKDMRIFVNGVLPEGRTGFERIDRNVLFSPVPIENGGYAVLLAGDKPVLKLKDGDKLSLGFQILIENNEARSEFCEERANLKNSDEQYMQFPYSVFPYGSGVLSSFPAVRVLNYARLGMSNTDVNRIQYYYADSRNLKNAKVRFCMDIMSRFDFKTYRRSVLFTDLANTESSAFINQYMDEVRPLYNMMKAAQHRHAPWTGPAGR